MSSELKAISVAETMEWDNLNKFKSGANKGNFRGAMKTYEDVPIYFGTKCAFTVEFNFDCDKQKFGIFRDYMSWKEFVNAVAAGVIDIEEPEDINGLIKFCEYDIEDEAMYKNEGFLDLNETLGFSDETIKDVMSRVETLAKAIYT